MCGLGGGSLVGGRRQADQQHELLGPVLVTPWSTPATEVQPGMRWHSLRRKLATDHRDGSLKVLCELGGWKSPKTVLECYQQADLESQRGLQAARYQPTPPTDTSGPIVATGNAG